MGARVPAAPLALLALLGLLCLSCAQPQAPAGNASVKAFRRVKSCAPVAVLVSPSNATDSNDGASSKSSIEVTAEDAVVKALDIQVGGALPGPCLAPCTAPCSQYSQCSQCPGILQRGASSRATWVTSNSSQRHPSAAKKPSSASSLRQQADEPRPDCPAPQGIYYYRYCHLTCSSADKLE